MMRYLIAALAVCFSTTAFALSGWQLDPDKYSSLRERALSVCAVDIHKYCYGVINASDGELITCLVVNKAKLSSKCSAFGSTYGM
jgi:hypothetical protein